MTTKPQKMKKIEFHGLDDRVFNDLFGEKPKSYTKISEELKADGYEISTTTIHNYKETLIKDGKEFLMKKPKIRQDMGEKLIDVVEESITLLEKLKDKIEQFDDRDDWKAQLGYINALLNTLNLLMKRWAILNPVKVVNQEFNVIQLNQAIQLQISDLIDSGDIDFESCSTKIQNWHKKNKAKV